MLGDFTNDAFPYTLQALYYGPFISDHPVLQNGLQTNVPMSFWGVDFPSGDEAPLLSPAPIFWPEPTFKALKDTDLKPAHGITFSLQKRPSKW